MHWIKLSRYPIFVPNDYLYMQYTKIIPGQETMEKWEIYDHAVNDFKCKEVDFSLNVQANRELVKLSDFVFGHKN